MLSPGLRRFQQILMGSLWSVRGKNSSDELLISASAFDARQLATAPELEPCDPWQIRDALFNDDSRSVALEILSEVRGYRVLAVNMSHADLKEAMEDLIDDRGFKQLHFFRVKRPVFRGVVFDSPAKNATPSPLQTALSWFRALVVDELGESVETSFRLDTPSGARSGSLTRAGAVDFDVLSPGVCRLAFPDIDDRCRHSHRMTPAKAGTGEVAYVPGVPLELPTDQSHRVAVPAFRDLRIEWPLDPAADEHSGIETHRFLLEGGSYSSSLTVSDDHAKRDHLLSLVFPDLFLGPQYTLKQIDADGSAHTLFLADFRALFPSAPTDHRDWPRVAHREGSGDEG